MLGPGTQCLQVPWAITLPSSSLQYRSSWVMIENYKGNSPRDLQVYHMSFQIYMKRTQVQLWDISFIASVLATNYQEASVYILRFSCKVNYYWLIIFICTFSSVDNIYVNCWGNIVHKSPCPGYSLLSSLPFSSTYMILPIRRNMCFSLQ